MSNFCKDKGPMGIFSTPRSLAMRSPTGGTRVALLRVLPRWQGVKRQEGTAVVHWNEDRPLSKKRRGFAAMDPERQREIASKGGRAAHEKGTAHEWTGEEARE